MVYWFIGVMAYLAGFTSAIVLAVVLYKKSIHDKK